MTVPIPVTEQVITTAWGTQVANDVNGLLADVETLVEATLPPRVTALETANNRQGIWWERTTNQAIGAGATSVVTNTSTIEATSGFSVSSGVVTIPTGRSGVYVAFVKISTGAATFSGAWLTIDNSFDVALYPADDRGGDGQYSGSGSLRLNAGQNVRAYIRNPTGGSMNVTAAHMHLWRVSA